MLVGGFGADTLLGGDGADDIDAKDGVRDVVDCGPGLDRVSADRQDRVVNCESSG